MTFSTQEKSKIKLFWPYHEPGGFTNGIPVNIWIIFTTSILKITMLIQKLSLSLSLSLYHVLSSVSLTHL